MSNEPFTNEALLTLITSPVRSQDHALAQKLAMELREYKLADQKPVPTDVANCLYFFASVIKSGEPWTETCQRELDKAKQAIEAKNHFATLHAETSQMWDEIVSPERPEDAKKQALEKALTSRLAQKYIYLETHPDAAGYKLDAKAIRMAIASLNQPAAQTAKPIGWYIKPTDLLAPFYTEDEARMNREVKNGSFAYPRYDSQPANIPLTVWYGSMPESNGKANWTAMLHRKGVGMVRGPYLTIDRSEYPDRVRLAADEARYLIGELAEEPDMLAYDTNKHSGYVAKVHPKELHQRLEWLTKDAHNVASNLDIGDERTAAFELYEVLRRLQRQGSANQILTVTNSLIKELSAMQLAHFPADKTVDPYCYDQGGNNYVRGWNARGAADREAIDVAVKKWGKHD